jgi:hypothetical protein
MLLRIRFAGHDAEVTQKFASTALGSEVIRAALDSRLAHSGGSSFASKWSAHVDCDGAAKELSPSKVIGDLAEDAVVTISKIGDGGGQDHSAARSPSSHVAPLVGRF